MKKPWFKAKEYGWGWQPSTWQGWLVLAVWLGLVLASFSGIDATSHSNSDTLINFLPRIIILTGLLIWVCVKTGEWPTWQWAGKPSTPPKVLGWTAISVVVFIALAFAMRFVFMHLR